MREVFSHNNSALIALHESVLRAAGIETYVGNQHAHQNFLGGMLSGAPAMPLFSPVLYVLHDEDYAEAMRLLSDTTTEGTEWSCMKCGETVPPELSECWKCSTPKPG